MGDPTNSLQINPPIFEILVVVRPPTPSFFIYLLSSLFSLFLIKGLCYSQILVPKPRNS